MIQVGTEAAMTIGYHDGHRKLQDEFESRKLADRLDDFARTAFSEDDKTFIESCAFFLLATADTEGRPDCSHKGGLPGFARVSEPDEIVFPDYDGNGMFKSLGNIAVNPNVGLLFINFEKPRRLRVTGTASISRHDPLLQHTVGAQLIVRVKAGAIFPNCPRYIPTMQFVEPSKYAPQPHVPFPEPDWKSFPDFAPIVHPRQKTFTG